MAYKYKMVNGKEVELTADEIKELEARDTEWAKGEFDRLMASIRQERTDLLVKTVLLEPPICLRKLYTIL